MFKLSETVELIEINPVKEHGPRVVAGFAGVGLVGYTAVSHIIREKGLKVKTVVRSHMIPPMIVFKNGKPSPSFAIYGDDSDETLFAVSNVMISPENTWIIGLKLMEWFRKVEAKEFVTVESMPQVVPQGRRPVYCFGVPECDLSNYGVHSIKEGGVSGLNAVVLDEAINDGIPFMNFLVPTSLASALDLWGALSVVEVLNRMYELDVDVSILKTRAEMIRPRVQKGNENKGIFSFFRKR